MKRVSLFSFDFILLGATLVLTVIGVLFIYSSNITSTGLVFSNEYIKQIIWALSGCIFLALFAYFGYNRLRNLSPYIYGFTLLLLLITALIGKEVNGARSWLGMGDYGVQPSEFAKLAVILFLAAYLRGVGIGVRELPRFVFGLGIVLLPMGLILLQPDMGTALVFVPIFLVMVFMAGARLRHIFFICAAGALVVVLSILPAFERLILERELAFFNLISNIDLFKYLLIALLFVVFLAGWGYFRYKRGYFYWILYTAAILLTGVLGSLAARVVLRDYQVMRLIIFMNPRVDPQGAGWNIIQSVTAVGSGGFWGKGFLQGTQSHYRFLPQQSTDFIFSILAEEWGFIGGMVVFLLFLVILIRGIRIAYTARGGYGLYVGSGIVALIFFHVIVNIGMAMGIMPITGIPLFFLSYGGSSLWTAMIGVGILLNIYQRRYQ